MGSSKLKYEVDPHNRLFVSETGKKSLLTRFRRVFDGSFKTGPNSSLIYHIKGPMYGLEEERKAPHQVKLRGKWSLNKNHDLVLKFKELIISVSKDKYCVPSFILKLDQ